MANESGTKTAGEGAKAPKATSANQDDAKETAGARPTAEGDAPEDSGSVGTVKYTGDAGVREISKADWKSVGIEADTVTWNAENDYTVLKSVFSDEQLEILKRDRGLKISS